VDAHAGAAACIVWDIDGTLFDPRPRMLRSVRAFGHVGATVDDVDLSWQRTAEALGLDPVAFHGVWNETFWDDDAFAHDAPIAETTWCLRWTAHLGLTPIFLTGRVESLRQVTVSQLRRLGFAAPRLLMKGDVVDSTAAFKAAAIRGVVDQGDVVAAFVTDSIDEINAVRASTPAIPCVLIRHGDVAADDDDGDDPLMGTITVASSDDDGIAETILPMGLPLSPWMVQSIADALGRALARVPVASPIVRLADVRALLDAEDVIDGVVDRIARVGLEHQLNDKEGLARRHVGNVDVRYGGGVRFALPCARVSPSDVDVVRSRHHATGDATALLQKDDAWLLPLHPQGFSGTPAQTLSVRATSSGRTVVVEGGGDSDDGDPLILKCHAPALVLDRHPRALPARDARHAVMIGDAFTALGVCHFPEVFAVVDVPADAACVVRRGRPFPAGPPGARTIPAYCLWAKTHAFDGGASLVARLRERFGDEVVMNTIMSPLVEIALHLSLDLGCAFMGHGQNTHVEFDRTWRPTGRVVVADLEDVWPHPIIAADVQLPFHLDDAYRAEHQNAAEANIENAFQDHFVWRLLHPLLQEAEALRPAVNEALRAGVVARRRQVLRFCPGPLSWFAETFL
jgi:phosphoglycolate phosphatase-like HAD superfamily hydrolase